MIWRGRSRYAILCLCALLLSATFGKSDESLTETTDPDTSSTALSVVDTCGACNILLVGNSEGGLGRLFAGTKFGTVASILSLTTNVVATCLTGYKAW